MPKVTVLMAVRNGERFLKQALDSVLAQDFDDYEVVVVDDGSTDATPGILAGYAASSPAVMVLSNPVNIGQTRSLNLGLRHARGVYVARLDADDVCEPGRLRMQSCFLDNTPVVGMVGSAIMVVDEHDNLLRTLPAPQGHDLLYARLMLYNTFFHSAIMARREIMLQAGGYNENLRFAQDYDLWLRMAELAELASLPEPLIRWREWENISAVNSRDQQESARETALASLSEKLAPEKLPPEPFRRFWWAYHRDCPGILCGSDVAALEPLWNFLSTLPAGAEAHGRGLLEFAYKLYYAGDFGNGRQMLLVADRSFGQQRNYFRLFRAWLRGLKHVKE